jgi:hypothetical protein
MIYLFPLYFLFILHRGIIPLQRQRICKIRVCRKSMTKRGLRTATQNVLILGVRKITLDGMWECSNNQQLQDIGFGFAEV